jgi:hypothetical protein
MSKTGAWLLKSFLTGAALGLATFAVFYTFLLVHQEVGVQPGSAIRLAIIVFVASTILALIYFRLKSE